MAFGKSGPGRKANHITHRCSACGEPLGVVERWDNAAGQPVAVVLACRWHPKADVLAWSSVDQAAATAIHQMLAAGRTWAEVDAICDAIPPTDRRKAPATTAAMLMRRWEGLPERGAITSSPSPLGLYGAPPNRKER